MFQKKKAAAGPSLVALVRRTRWSHSRVIPGPFRETTSRMTADEERKSGKAVNWTGVQGWLSNDHGSDDE
jgi:hypothetical protein